MHWRRARAFPNSLHFRQCVGESPTRKSKSAASGTSSCRSTIFQPKRLLPSVATTYAERWQKRFEEDLVELLSRMGHPPQDKVKLAVQSPTSGETKILENVRMSEANRHAIKSAADNRSNDQPSEDDAAETNAAGNLPIDANLRRRLAGRYQLDPSFIFTVRDRDGHLMVGITDQPTQEVFPDSATRWSYRGVDATLEFKLPKTGRARRLVLHQNGMEQSARRID